jgi:hypothetical protein
MLSPQKQEEVLRIIASYGSIEGIEFVSYIIGNKQVAIITTSTLPLQCFYFTSTYHLPSLYPILIKGERPSTLGHRLQTLGGKDD